MNLKLLILCCLFFFEGQAYNKDEIEKISICMGNLLWQNLNEACSHYDCEVVIRTLKELSSKERAPMDMEECYGLMETVWAKMIEEEAEKNLSLAEAFLGKVAKKSNVIEVNKDKLYYEILQIGEGEIVTEKDSPILHFKETDLSGKVIQDTTAYAPLKITLAETIKGFAEGVRGMRVGEKRRIYVHPDLAYGKFEGQEPQQLLIFEVEVIEN